MIVLFTDFGPSGPYLGQMKAVLARAAPGVAVIDLLSDAPAFDPRSSAYLLAAYAPEFPAGTVFLCVVDPGVGGARAPLAVSAAGRWYVGPDNGLFAIVMRRARAAQTGDNLAGGPAGGSRVWEIAWRPERLSATFHGRDLFAPVAARLARGESPPGDERPAARVRTMAGADWPDDLARIVYIDHYGNAVTGLRAETLDAEAVLRAAGRELRRAVRFSDLPPGAPFWYENANGLAEIAVNQGRAAQDLGLALGTEVAVVSG
ncbi:MAG: SAM-dependent chlorinase/fluorinase [Proteobacteria bacterium]|nr:SAM-dependent chlorinase/fluorinase [Pseudomonadota bacterium]